MGDLLQIAKGLPGLRRIPGFGTGAEVPIRDSAAPVRTVGAEKGYDLSPYPNGWIVVGFSHELARGQVKPVRCLGRELVMFRGMDGQACVTDAYCPHLGAHLGVGGTVVGNDLRCPFHGWQWSGAGACTAVPHARKIPPKAQLRAWRVREINGGIFIWHHAEDRPPEYELPELSEYGSPEWSTPQYRAYRIRTRWHELVENSVDRTHFFALHGYPEPPALEFEAVGPRFSMRSRVRWKRFGRDTEVVLNIDSFGPGMAVIRGVGEAPFIVMGCPMPIDADHMIHRLTFLVSKEIPLLLREVVIRFVIYTAVREFQRDVPIWENKVYKTRPVLCDADGPIGRFRIWSRQFSASRPIAGGGRDDGASAD
jgi:nitrite reductase/ring-hydroxylating ferredoxin subunit